MEQDLKEYFAEIERTLDLRPPSLSNRPEMPIDDKGELQIPLSENFWVNVPTRLIKHSRLLLLYKVTALERLVKRQ